MFIGRTDAEAEIPILWPPDVKNWLIWKDPDAGKDWWQKEKRAAADEIVRQHHWLNAHEIAQTHKMVKDRGVWCAAVHGVAKSQMQLSDWRQTYIARERYTHVLLVLFLWRTLTRHAMMVSVYLSLGAFAIWSFPPDQRLYLEKSELSSRGIRK